MYSSVVFSEVQTLAGARMRQVVALAAQLSARSRTSFALLGNRGADTWEQQKERSPHSHPHRGSVVNRSSVGKPTN